MQHSTKYLIIFFLVFVVISCKKKIKKERISKEKFTLVSNNKSNVDFVNLVTQTNNFNCLNYTYALAGGGVATADFNNDGLEDVYFISNQNANKLYLNKGNFTFDDITSSAKVEDKEGWSTGVSIIDINNDGWQDIYVCKSASLNDNAFRKNKLFINQKNNTFKEEAQKWGLDSDAFSMQSYFFDYDNDGDLDMYLVNHRVDFKNTLRLEKIGSQQLNPQTSDHLFRNDGNKFTDVTLTSGIANSAWGLSASIGDFNNDGWPDIYVANDYIIPDFLYINKRNGTFSNQINTRLNHISYNSMGSDVADINNDFLPDLMVLEMSAQDHIRSKENMPSMNTEGFQKIVNAKYHYPYMSNMLQLNNGNGSLSDIGQLANVAKTDWSWATLMADFDNDGHKDIVVTNGIERNFANQDYARKIKENLDNNVSMTKMEVIDMIPSEKIANYIYKNNSDLTFDDVSKKWGFDKKINSNGIAYADLDNDGDLDLILNNMSDLASIYRNNSTNNFLKLKLIGDKKNRNAIGSKVKIYTDKGNQYQELYTSRGYLSSVTNILNFGLKKQEYINTVEVIWHNGLVTKLENVKTNQTLVLNINDAYKTQPIKQNVNRNIKSVDPKRLGIDFIHKENDFNDFSKQVLLPQKLSQKGPALAVADINSDGFEDFFVGGARNQVSEIYLQNATGSFVKSKQKLLEKDKNYEDINALFFDADKDGDLDLYVVSSNYEVSEKNKYSQDRLYINNGKGVFSKSKNLPKNLNATNVVKAFDYDNDGDEDLFIGASSLSGKYPLSGKSYILENKKGVFKETTTTVCNDLSEIGIVKDFLFSDVDNDGDKDLFVVGHWFPITLFINDNGNFEKSITTDFENTNGWYNTIAEIDVDNDGNKDYVVGNLGNNNKFHPSKEKPLHIYANNFDENETFDMVLSKEYKGNLVPVRGKECSTQQNSFISAKTKTYKEFANSTLIDIYGDKALEDSYHKEVHNFSSMLIKNKGNQAFTIQKLPNSAQLGPTQSFEITDVNNDGLLDVVGVGAIHESEVETIRYDANIGYILAGTKEGNLVPYKDLGFYNAKNAKKNKKLKIGNNIYFIVANNDAELSIFKK
ncbi:VCBS repeat-containing protein [uncultured Polaribacter sp.]|uniref:VCBS repeat-containing protein n=1 Tax=uncultured Polaribacter sp. TaxID=174711 RepID=UPI002629E012|nr:VCBS repeat-containing protein [uncultured Polaribacter sp.]